MSIKKEETFKTEIYEEKKFSDLSSSSSSLLLPKRRKRNSSSFDSTTTIEFKSSPSQSPSSPSTTTNTSSSSSSTGRKPRLIWTKEEDEALFNAISSVLARQWGDVCSKNPILKARGASMVAQRFKTKIRYFVGGNAERTKQ
ncbi:hypothetical protein Glove_271g8 [Diversispora epigaea]|uniref:Myb-like domain-containing protein n=1 Tax=Diversispora epigaea TaxID=1348612 RepID=A0A397I852_9GLOM|nr:hypothetical protein Glove_271g8 [Diversispora epigaea]